MVHDDEAVGLDGTRVECDDERVVADAAAMLVATLAQRLRVEALAEELVGCGVIGRARRTWGAR